MSDGTESPTVGEILRGRRLESGLDVEDLAERTRIRRTYLLALEENRFDLLPGDAYLTGFLRVYASALGLRPEKITALYREQTGARASSGGDAAVRRPEGAVLRPGPVARGSWVWLAVTVLVIAALALVNLILPQPQPAPSFEAREQAAPASDPPAAEATVADTAVDHPEVSPPVAPATAAETATASDVQPEPAAGGTGERVAAEPAGIPLTIAFPGNSQVRLDSSGPNRISIRSDDRPGQSYDLTSAASLSWRIRQSAHIQVASPAGVKLWVGDRSVEIGSHSELFLQAAEASGGP